MVSVGAGGCGEREGTDFSDSGILLCFLFIYCYFVMGKFFFVTVFVCDFGEASDEFTRLSGFYWYGVDVVGIEIIHDEEVFVSSGRHDRVSAR